MNYEEWKTSTPTNYDYEENKKCGFCDRPINDSNKIYCSYQCEKADNTEGV